ncbi:MAG TPA: dihydrolipoamide acetyltransferase family protein [bacterium]|nr:dihydrolipoamide acetyltransferase family protein [bacterium]
MIDMIMPQMGESIVEGTIVRWRKRLGEPVQRDEMILEISTDKVDSEIPSPATGILAEITAVEGRTVAVGSVIARIQEQDTASRPPLDSAGPLPAFPSSDSPHPSKGERRFLSPLVKRIMREHSLTETDVQSLQGSGHHGRISKKDLLAFLHARRQAVAPPVVRQQPGETSQPISDVAGPDENDEIIAMDHVRRRIAEHMVFSKRTAAHVTSVAEVDVTSIVAYRDRVKEQFEKREGVSLTYTAFFVHAAAQALREFPLLHASVNGDQIILKKAIHIGIAVGLEQGLVVPVIRHADQQNLLGLAKAIDGLVQRSRNKQLAPQEVQDGTFTITNIGTFGNLFGTPIIHQPQVAILGTGAIKKRVAVLQDDCIAIRSMMYLSLTYDHRLIDGLLAGRFLQRIVALLQNFQYE